jgi:toxin ParE1/3/4
MNYKVNFSANAERDLFEIYSFVYQNDGEINADYLINNIQSKFFELQEFPVRGHTLPELLSFNIADFLEIHFKSYRIIYQVYKTEVLIHCILDGRRDIKKILEERLLR